MIRVDGTLEEYKEMLRQEVKEEIKEELKEEVKEQVKEEVREEIKQEVKEQLIVNMYNQKLSISLMAGIMQCDEETIISILKKHGLN